MFYDRHDVTIARRSGPYGFMGGLPAHRAYSGCGLKKTLSYPDLKRGEGGWCHGISFLIAPHGCTVNGRIPELFMLMSTRLDTGSHRPDGYVYIASSFSDVQLQYVAHSSRPCVVFTCPVYLIAPSQLYGHPAHSHRFLARPLFSLRTALVHRHCFGAGYLSLAITTYTEATTSTSSHSESSQHAPQQS